MTATLRLRVVAAAPALAAAVFGLAAASRADNDPAVLRGVQFLRGRSRDSQIGETALITLAMLKADVPPGDPAVAACVARLRTRFASGGYNPERTNGHDVYEAGVVALALANLPGGSTKAELEALAKFLVGRQKANGSWDYEHRTTGDASISQYAVLGLWECENGGVTVPPSVWDHAADFYIGTQAAGGSWNYHRDEGGPETISMTAAGTGSLLICQRQLQRYRNKGPEAGSALLTPVVAAGASRYDPVNSNARLNEAIRRGLAWMGAHFTTAAGEAVVGPTPYYALYGVERLGALADRKTLGRVDWFDAGRRFIATTQRGDGAWDSTHGDVPNTAWALLFITKSTEKTLKRVEVARRLGAGTLLGGRGLPRDLSNLTVAGGRVVSRPMNGAVEGMLAVLEDPRAENADAALTGLVTRYRTEGAAALKPHKDRFSAMLKDRDPGVRKVAAWALARTGEMDVVPTLIGALTDPDGSVVTVAREGLQLLSRKIDGFGPPASSTPEQRNEAAAKWRAWYANVRPLDLEGHADPAARPAPGAAR